MSNNTALTSMTCLGNSLTTLDVSNNTALLLLSCGSNALTTLDVSNNTALFYLACDDNSLTTTLDLSNHSNLNRLYINDNNLTIINVANGNNTDFVTFNATNNPNLTCIQVDNVAWSITNWTVAGSNIDATASFSLNCSVGIDEIATQEMSVYPNPASSQITIDIEEQIETIVIINVMGKTVKTITSTNNTINVSDLTKGIYFLQIQTNKGLASKKFIKE